MSFFKILASNLKVCSFDRAQLVDEGAPISFLSSIIVQEKMEREVFLFLYIYTGPLILIDN